MKHASRFLQLNLLFASLLFRVPPSRADHFVLSGVTNHQDFQDDAILLQNGKVLIAGGAQNPTQALLYDPETRIGRTLTPMSGGHVIGTATLLNDGRALIVAGDDNSLEIFDPVLETWTNALPLPYAISRHTSTLLPNGKLLIAGGQLTDYSPGLLYTNCFLFDSISWHWTETQPMLEPRRRHTATLLNSGKVLVAGGFNSGPTSLIQKNAELYDPATESWTYTGALNIARRFHTATLLPSGKVLVAGGERTNLQIATATAELYDPTTESWTLTGPMNTGRVYHAACLLPNGKVLVTGGEYRQASGQRFKTSEIFDPVAETWSPGPLMNNSRYEHSATPLSNGQVLVGTELYIAPSQFALTNQTQLSNGSFQFEFVNVPGAICDAFAATNISLPLSNWTALGGVTEISPGQFQFTDPQATNSPQRFYRVRAN